MNYGIIIVLSGPFLTERYNALCRSVFHADFGTAGDGVDDGIGAAAGRNAHASRGSACRHLRVIGNRARLEEKIGISVPQPVVLGEIILDQLIHIQHDFQVIEVGRDGKSLKTVDARQEGPHVAEVLIADTEKIRENAHFHRDIIGRRSQFVVLIVQAHSHPNPVRGAYRGHAKLQTVGRRIHSAGSVGECRGRFAGGQQLQLPCHLVDLILDEQRIHEILHRGGFVRRVHGDALIKIAVTAIIQPFDQLCQGIEPGAVTHRKGVVLDQGAVGIHDAQIQHLLI